MLALPSIMRMRTPLPLPALALLLLALAPASSRAQRTLYDEQVQAEYRRAERLYQERQYAAAERAFAAVADRLPPPGTEDAYGDRTRAAYYRAVSAAELFNPDAERLLVEFRETNAAHPLAAQARYQLGRYHFRNKDYRSAMDELRQVDPAVLSPEDRSDFHFQLGYGYFRGKELANARALFAQVREYGDAEYYYAANFYLGYIALEDGDTDVAADAFEVAALSPEFEDVVPYFRARIAFAEGDDDRAIELAEPYVDRRRQPYALELHQLLGQAWYRKGEHERALPYLQYYVDKARRLEPEDYFQLGVALYKAGQYEDAIGNLERLDGSRDSLAQQALYLVGDAHLQSGDKEAARGAFQAAARLEMDPGLARDARFLYAKLSYELGFADLAIAEWQAWLAAYPDAPAAAEARSLLVDALLRSRDFGRALDLLESMALDAPALRRAYQEVAFYRGVERFGERAYAEAEALFGRSRRQPEDPALDAAALFWQAEAVLAQGRDADGIRDHEAFQRKAEKLDRIPGNASVAASAYSVGYAQLRAERFGPAATQFSRVLDRWNESSPDPSRARMAADARMRLADCRFALKDYAAADAGYARIVQAGGPGTDYALFQRGMLQGLQGRLDEKTRLLGQLHRDHPQSPYADDALYEKGNAHFVQGQNASAEQAFRTLLDERPNSAYAARTLLKMALIAYTDGRLEEAARRYTEVTEKYRGSPEAREALAGLRDVSVDLDRPELYASVGQVSASAQDSVTWEAAYDRVLAGDCAQAEPALERYILRFPDGYFLESARFYRGECRYAAERYPSALADYEAVLALRDSRFRETALIKAARIAYFDLKDYDRAADWYGELVERPEWQEHRSEALKGLVRSLALEADHEGVLRHAGTWIDAASTPPEERTEARFLRAKASLALGRRERAAEDFAAVAAATRDERGVESRFQLALMDFNAGRYEEAKEACLALIRETPGYESWVIRSYILIADALREQDELVQAKAALRSIVDHYEGDPALLELARAKLAEIEALERQRARLSGEGDDADDFLDLVPVDPAGAPENPQPR
jgi:TolA-binding protein